MKTKTPIFITIASIFLFATLILSSQHGHAQRESITQSVTTANVPKIAYTLTFTPTDWVYLPVIQTPCYTTDDFSNIASGWHINETAIGKWEYTNNEYRIASYDSGYVLWSRAPFEAQENYVVEIDTHWNAAPTNGLYGLLFGMDAVGDNYYLYIVYPSTQQYRLYLKQGSSWTELVGRTTSSAIKTGTAVNHLAVSRQGNNIDLYINNTKVKQLTNSVLTGPTYTGIAMSAPSTNPQVDARYDNFKITGCVASIPVFTMQQQASPIDAVDILWE